MQPSDDTTSHPALPAVQSMDSDAAAAGINTAVRATVLELLKHGLLEQSSKPNLYRNAVLHRPAIEQVLQWLELRLEIDEIRGLAFLMVATGDAPEDDEWSHPLVRRQRLTLEQSLLLAILRQQFIAHERDAGVGAGNAQVSLDDLLPHLQAYLGDPGSEALERKRLLGLLEQLKGHGIVSDIDQQERVTIRPIIAHLANPENLGNLIQELRALTGHSQLSAQEQARP